MTIKDELNQAVREAMKAGDARKKTTLRLALAAIKNAEIDKSGPLDETAVMGILQKEVKSCREAIEDATRAGRPELAAEAETEIVILEAFLPKPLSAAELDALVRAVIEETGATSVREMGQVMSVLMPRVAGRAEGRQVSGLVRQLLQG